MRYRHLILVLLFVPCWLSAVAQEYTELAGPISGTLSFEDSPYLLINDVFIQEGDQLIIEPGVEVFVTGGQGYDIQINGEMIAEGTPDSLISFKGYLPDSPEDITWNGLRYFGSLSNPDSTAIRFSYTTVENASFAVWVSSRAGVVTGHHNIYKNCDNGIVLMDSPVSRLYHNTFYDLSEDGQAIAFSSFQTAPVQHTVENNIISETAGGVSIFWLESAFDPDCDQYLIDYNCFNTGESAVTFLSGSCEFDTLNNIFEDPLFDINAPRLSEDSPCIDAGNPLDYLWDPDGSPPDLGALYFDQAIAPASYRDIIPDTIAVAGHVYWDYILAAGRPTPVNQMIYTYESIRYDSTTGYLSMNPTLADTGVYHLGFRAENSYEDSTWVDSLLFDLHVLPNTSPRIVDFSPQCEQQSGDTTFCSNYFPLEQVTLSVTTMDDEGDPISRRWRYLDQTYTHSNEFTISLEQQGENLVEFYCDDGSDTTWHYWEIFASGTELSGEILQEELTIEEGPYVMMSTTWVAEEDTLVVEPGVKIYVATHLDDSKIEVQGYLSVQGTENLPVQVFSNSTNGFSWEGIQLLPGALGADISYLELSGAKRGLFVQYSDGPVVVSHCDFLADSIGIQSHYSDIQIQNCVFHNENESFSIENRVHYAIFIEGDDLATITNCGFGRVFDPIYLYRADAEIINNTFAHTGSQNSQLQFHPITALYSDLRVVNNIFYNFSDVSMFVDSYSHWSEVAYNCFYPDSLVSNNSGLSSDSSLFENPLLELGNNAFDLHLQNGSPCIDTGAPYLLDPDDTRSDMGMYGGPGAGATMLNREFISATQPVVFRLTGIFPNPFNATTNIDFNLPETGAARLEVFNLRGQRVALLLDEQMNAGRQIISFDGNNVASGIYLVRLQQGTHIATGKMLLVK